MAQTKNITISNNNSAVELPAGTNSDRPIQTVIFSTTGTSTWNVPADVSSVEVLIVGGGGGSGGGGSSGYHGGGGGGGGVVYHPNFTVTPNSGISVTVGNGGAAGTQSGDSGFTGSNGGNSAFGTLIANGGGGGGANSQNSRRGSAGGSGGGGGLYSGTGGASNQPSYTGATVYGNSGGTAQSDYGSAGGGGGAGSAGTNGVANIGGNGGNGIPFDITGTTLFYGGGGAGAGNSRHGEAVRGATPAYTTPADGTGAGGGGRQSTSGQDGSNGIVVVRYAVGRPPSEWVGFTRFNTQYSVRELWNGKNWVNADNGLTIGLGESEFAPAPSAKYIKEATPNVTTNRFYWIRPPGVDKAYQIWCDMDTLGGGWMLLWYNHGGPQQSGNSSMYGIMNGSESDNVRPFQYGGTKGFGKARHAEHWMNQAGGTIMKTYAGYNSSNTKLNGSQSSDSGLTDGAGGNNGRLYWSDTSRVVADRLELGDRVTYRDIVGTSIGTTSSYAVTTLNNRVSLFLDNGTTPGSRLYGQTNQIISTTGNRGFSNYLDPNGTEPYMLHWAARHWISYSSNASGSNANRCQYVCYGSENLWIEHGWFYREQGISQ